MRKVVCISTTYINKMSLGKVYDVLDDNPRGFLLRNDDGATYWFFKDNFKEVDKMAEQKIKVLCVDEMTYSYIKSGRFYDADDYNTDYYQLVNDEGSLGLYRKACFVVPVLQDEVLPTKESVKPPIGLVPRYVYEQQCNDTRIDDIVAAINRYFEDKRAIPIEWIEEVNERILGENK